MIVAHPDDELIFGGKELLKEKGWKVICITNGTQKSNNIFSFKSNINTNTRSDEFIMVMNKLNYAYEIWDFEDNYFNNNWNKLLLVQQLLNVFYGRNYKKIVTHNLNGEYGHKQHKKISEIIHKLKPNNLYVFDFKETEINPYIDELNELLYLYKSQKQIIQKYYKYIVHQSIKKVT